MARRLRKQRTAALPLLASSRSSRLHVDRARAVPASDATPRAPVPRARWSWRARRKAPSPRTSTRSSPPPRRRAWAPPGSSTSRCSSSTWPHRPKYYPWLATGYKWSNGGKSVTFTIRQGVKWNNGTPMTPADVAFTYNLVKTNPAINLAGLQIISVSTSGNTVTLTFPNPQYTNLQQIAGVPILPQSVWGKRVAIRRRSRTRTRSARARTS